MAQRTDPFGEAVKEYHNTGEAIEFRERDDGCIEANSVEIYFGSYDDWLPCEQEAVNRATGRILNIGCGVGRHALYLQEQGHSVLGMDVSPGALEVAEERGLSETLQLDVAALDEYEGEPFDTVCMFGNNFGLVGTTDRAPKILNGISKVTGDDATILAGSMNPHDTKDPAHLTYHEQNEEQGRLAGALKLRIRYKCAKTDWFDYLLAAPEEMELVLMESEWEVSEFLQDSTPFYVGLLQKD